jgi:hypothetical protein
MRKKFLAYAVIVVLISSMASWGSMSRRAMGGSGGWYGGGTGGGWAGAGGGGHK